MSDTFEILKEQTLIARSRVAMLAKANAAKADVIPAGWNNNLRWHVGHLLVTPRRLTSLQMGLPMGLPDEYGTWFAKGSSPKDWQGGDVPALEQLIEEMLEDTARVFEEMEPRLDARFPKEYETTLGTVLRTPADGLTMSFIHDGIHIGLLLALVRTLKA